MSSSFPRICTLALWSLILLQCGCGPSGPQIFPVSGVVTKGGKPVPSATVTFYPASGKSSWGLTDESGKFVLQYDANQPGAVGGEHRVSIVYGGPQPPPQNDGEPGKRAPAAAKSEPLVSLEWPEAVTVSKDATVFEFALKN
ncbi:carboxypeptidase-like regulatory domain-containing protein [Lacunimicrobium album]